MSCSGASCACCDTVDSTVRLLLAGMCGRLSLVVRRVPSARWLLCGLRAVNVPHFCVLIPADRCLGCFSLEWCWINLVPTSPSWIYCRHMAICILCADVKLGRGHCLTQVPLLPWSLGMQRCLLPVMLQDTPSAGVWAQDMSGRLSPDQRCALLPYPQEKGQSTGPEEQLAVASMKVEPGDGGPGGEWGPFGGLGAGPWGRGDWPRLWNSQPTGGEDPGL